MTEAPRPVLKWAGGKSRSLSHILGRLPASMGTYFEPFVGGAAVFFALAAEGRFRRAVLSDRNAALVEVYDAIKTDVERVIELLSAYRYEKSEYYRIRRIEPDTLDPIERAGRLIYLNKTGYNGLYRVNRQGRFNVPFGRYKNPKICDADNLRAASKALSKARLVVADFEKACERAKEGDAVYFDPPYDPVSKTASFTAYHHEAFDEDDHGRLARVFGDLAGRGVHAVLSNSDTRLTRKLYRPWTTRRVAVTRPINSKGSARGAIDEILVTNQRPPNRRARRA